MKYLLNKCITKQIEYYYLVSCKKISKKQKQKFYADFSYETKDSWTEAAAKKWAWVGVKHKQYSTNYINKIYIYQHIYIAIYLAISLKIDKA